MGVVVVIVIVLAIIAGIVWNHINAKQAHEGTTFVVPHPPSMVASAIQQAYNQGAGAALLGKFSGVRVTPLGPESFATATKIGDSGEISISKDSTGSRVTTRTLSLYVGQHPRTLGRSGLYGLASMITNGFCKMVGLTPNAARMKRWQNGLEGRITKAIARASA